MSNKFKYTQLGRTFNKVPSKKWVAQEGEKLLDQFFDCLRLGEVFLFGMDYEISEIESLAEKRNLAVKYVRASQVESTAGYGMKVMSFLDEDRLFHAINNNFRKEDKCQIKNEQNIEIVYQYLDFTLLAGDSTTFTEIF